MISVTSEASIRIDDVTHGYRTSEGPLPVLKELSLEVLEGSFCAVVGPSGCGKSTLTRLIAGLLFPDRGEILLNNQRVTSPRNTVGMAFQNPVLLEWRTILKNVLLPLEIVPNNLTQKQMENRGLELLAMVGLQGFENKKPSELSGGMRQRASLCRALVHRPEVLIMDEPFGALDAFTREDLWQVMHELRHAEAFTCLLITHDLREAVFLSDQVVVLSGRPAKKQFSLEVPLGRVRILENLFDPEIINILRELREQIQFGQEQNFKDKEGPG